MLEDATVPLVGALMGTTGVLTPPDELELLLACTFIQTTYETRLLLTWHVYVVTCMG